MWLLGRLTVGYNAQYMQCICQECSKVLMELSLQNALHEAICQECWDKTPEDMRFKLDLGRTRAYFIRDFSK